MSNHPNTSRMTKDIITDALTMVNQNTNCMAIRAHVKQEIEQGLLNQQAQMRIEDFKVICDETNNSPEVVSNNELNVSVVVKPNRVAEFIKINVTQFGDSIKFDDPTEWWLTNGKGARTCFRLYGSASAEVQTIGGGIVVSTELVGIELARDRWDDLVKKGYYEEE